MDIGKGDPVFFSQELECLDLRQCRLENSYFASSFVALADQPGLFVETITQVFDGELDYSHMGLHGIWLFIDGLWECITIDDLLPVVLGDYPFTHYYN